MTETLRVGIVGLGIGKPNANALSAHPRGEVTALCDLDEDRMRAFAAELPDEPAQFTDYEAMCADDRVDAVFVGTPNQLHVPVARAAVRAGKHVLVTKPLADSVASARELVDEAERAGVANMMSLSMRFGSECIHLGRQRDRGAFGDIYYGRARSVRRSGIPAWNAGFIRAGGGAFRDMGIHVLDMAWWLMGMPEPVSAFGTSGAKFGPRGEGYFHFQEPPAGTAAQFEADDYTCGLVRFAGGAALQVESFWASHQPGEVQVELFGTEAGARVFPPTIYRTENGAPHDTAIEPPPKAPTSWERIADHFIACALDGTTCAAPLRHGLRVQQMLEAVLESAHGGREVAIDARDTATSG